MRSRVWVAVVTLLAAGWMRPATLPAAAAQRTSDRPAAARDGKSLRSLELALAPLAKRYAIGRTPVDRNDWDPGVLAGPPSGRVVPQVVVVFDERGVKHDRRGDGVG